MCQMGQVVSKIVIEPSKTKLKFKYHFITMAIIAIEMVDSQLTLPRSPKVKCKLIKRKSTKICCFFRELKLVSKGKAYHQ